MTVRELCAAVVTQSDNAATNVLLRGDRRTVGAHGILPHDRRQRLAARSLRARAQQQCGRTIRATRPRRAPWSIRCWQSSRGDVLTISSRALLIDWMTRLQDRPRPRARRPAQILEPAATRPAAATMARSTIIVITYPPDRRPIFIAVYMSESKLTVPELSAAHAEIGRIVGAREMEIGDTMNESRDHLVGRIGIAGVGRELSRRAESRPRADPAADRRSRRRRPGAVLGILRSLRSARAREDGHRRPRRCSTTRTAS